jgi:glycosyltransferase involved in cell wall biosynthesis
MSSILFISNQATRTGAPIVLLHFLRWFKQKTSIPFVILLTEGGDLEADFASLAPIFVLERSDFSHQNLVAELAIYDISLIYANGVGNSDVLLALSPLKCSVIFYIHELEYNISCAPAFKQTQQHTHQYIAASEAVYLNLIHNHHIPQQKIEIIHEFIPVNLPQIASVEVSHKKQKLCAKLDIPENALLVGGSGTIEWRKGTDIFVQLAYLIRRKYPEIPAYFIWVGKPICADRFRELLHDMNKLDLEPYIHFVGEQLNPLDYFSILDVFVLPSREDPYPLVCLEAASVSKPIVCFDRGGGIREFVEDDCGFVVPYLDIDEMATAVFKILQSDELQRSLGERGTRKLKERHDLEIVAPKLLNIIKRFLPVVEMSNISDTNTLVSLLEIQNHKIKNKLINTETEQTRSNLQKKQLKLQQIEAQLQIYLNTITAMHTSKFWKLRSQWFKLKRLLHMKDNE